MKFVLKWMEFQKKINNTEYEIEFSGLTLIIKYIFILNRRKIKIHHKIKKCLKISRKYFYN